MNKISEQYIRNQEEQERLEKLEKLASTFAKRASEHDRDGSFPFENFADLQEAGFFKLTVPKRYGGDEISLYELVQVQEALAYGDGSTALAFGWHPGQTVSISECFLHLYQLCSGPTTSRCNGVGCAACATTCRARPSS